MLLKYYMIPGKFDATFTAVLIQLYWGSNYQRFRVRATAIFI